MTEGLDNAGNEFCRNILCRSVNLPVRPGKYLFLCRDRSYQGTRQSRRSSSLSYSRPDAADSGRHGHPHIGDGGSRYQTRGKPAGLLFLQLFEFRRAEMDPSFGHFPIVPQFHEVRAIAQEQVEMVVHRAEIKHIDGESAGQVGQAVGDPVFAMAVRFAREMIFTAQRRPPDAAVVAVVDPRFFPVEQHRPRDPRSGGL